MHGCRKIDVKGGSMHTLLTISISKHHECQNNMKGKLHDVYYMK